MKARVVTSPSVTGQPRVDSHRVNAIDMPQGAGRSESITLTGAPNTITVGGFRRTSEQSYPEQNVRFPLSFAEGFKVPQGTYDVTIPFKQ